MPTASTRPPAPWSTSPDSGIGGSTPSSASPRRPTQKEPIMQTPPIVSPEEWEAARLRLLVKEKELTKARDGMAAERRRMPWMAVEKSYEFEGPAGEGTPVHLFEGRPQLIVYPAVFGPRGRGGAAPRGVGRSVGAA